MILGGRRAEEGEDCDRLRRSENVMPKTWLKGVATLIRQEGVRFTAANGEEIGNYGRKKIDFEPIEEEDDE